VHNSLWPAQELPMNSGLASTALFPKFG